MYKRFVKRLLDIIFSAMGIVFLSPIMLIIAVLVRCNLGSPVIFTQDRPGKNERIFKLYKFRTMTDKKDKFGNLLPDEKRLPKFGRMLRSTSLDELPELFNILKGDMSIVGPRPLLVKYLPYYKSSERVRHLVRPGLTGLAQVSGRNNLGWDERLGLDVKYVNHISLKGDLQIIKQTISKVLKGSDIAVGNQLTLQDLDVERKPQ